MKDFFDWFEVLKYRAHAGRKDVQDHINEIETGYLNIFECFLYAESFENVIEFCREGGEALRESLYMMGWRGTIFPEDGEFTIAPHSLITVVYGTDGSGPFLGFRYHSSLQDLLAKELMANLCGPFSFDPDFDPEFDRQLFLFLCQGLYGKLLEFDSQEITMEDFQYMKALLEKFGFFHYDIFCTVSQYIQQNEKFAQLHEKEYEEIFEEQLLFFDQENQRQWEWALSKLPLGDTHV